MKNLLSVLFLMRFLFLGNTEAATCTAMASGNWEVTSTWSCGAVPACGDSVVIPSGTTVTITTILDYTACGSTMKITVKGILTFQTGKKIKLSCGSKIYIINGGTIAAGGGGGSSNLIDICGTTVWTASQGSLSGPDCLPPDPLCSSGALPVEFIYFSAIKEHEKHVKLSWETTSEINSKSFTVEKSQNGADFQQVSNIDGAGNSTSLQYYSWTDQNPGSGMFYYRIRQTDYNGQFSFSKIIAVKFSLINDFAIYPNPSSGDVFINLNSEFAGMKIRISIENCLGVKIYEKSLFADEQSFGFHLSDIQNKLTTGVYLITVSGGSILQQKKLLIK